MSKTAAHFASSTLTSGTGETSGASKELESEVFSKMKNDEINDLIKKDSLLITFGNAVIKENYRNQLKRGKYTSDKLRLVARVIIEAQKGPSNHDCDVEALIKANKFKDIVRAAKFVSGLKLDEFGTETFDHPTNVRKLGQHFSKIASIKATEGHDVK
jgi:hypothetical protein